MDNNADEDEETFIRVDKKHGGVEVYRLNLERKKHGFAYRTGTGNKKNGVTTVTYDNGVKHGAITFIGPESVSQLTYENDVRQGPYRGWGPGRWSRPGEVMFQTSTFINDTREGLGINMYGDGDFDEYWWENGVIHGYYGQTRAPFKGEPAYKDHLEYDENERVGYMLRETTDENGNLAIKYQRRREDDFVKLLGFDFDKNSIATIVETLIVTGNIQS